MFISKEIEELSIDYLSKPFGDKKDKRVERWLELLNQLNTQAEVVNLKDEVRVDLSTIDLEEIESIFLEFLPWRKGPFRINNLLIDSEWNSDLKWKRLQALKVNLKNKSILDVGSGNGYYAFRMLGMGAKQVLCLEPNLVHVSQFTAINKLVDSKKIRMIPERLESSGIKQTEFDCVFSMGLLYHQRNPQEHLQNLKDFLKSDGQMIIETIIAPDSYGMALEPVDRYASMPNVHLVHTDLGCKSMFKDLKLDLVSESDTVPTSHLEQRKTKWMPFKSFESALNQDNQSLTIEGYPAPSRKFYLLEPKF